MAATIRRLMGAKGNLLLRKKNGEKKKSIGRRNVTVMAYVSFLGMKEEYETMRLSPGATEEDVKSTYIHLIFELDSFIFCTIAYFY